MCKSSDAPPLSAAATSPATTPAASPTTTKTFPNTVCPVDPKLPLEIQQLEQELARRLEHREPVVWKVGQLGPYYQQWVFKTRTKQPICFFANRLAEMATYSHWFVVLLCYAPVLGTYWVHVDPQLSGLQRILFILLGLATWPFIEHAMHRYIFHMNTSTYMWNILHFCFHGQHHVCICDPLRLVFPPHIAIALSTPFKLSAIRLFGWDRGLCWALGMSFGFIMYDMCHHALHHTHIKFLQKLRLRHLTHHYGNPHKYFGVSHEFTDEWFGTGGWGKREVSQAKEYEKNE